MAIYNNFEFNGIQKDYVTAVEELNIDYGPNRSVDLVHVPGALGAQVSQVEDKEKTITLKIVIKAPPGQSLEDIADDMVGWLYTDNAETRTLRLSRQEEKYYNVFVAEPISREEIVTFAKCTVEFVCPEGRSYSVKEKSNTFTQNFVSVVNNGTVKTPFRFIATALKDAPYLFLGDESKNFERHIMFGDDNEEKPLNNYSPSLIIDEFRPGSLSTFSMSGQYENIPDRYLGGTTGASFNQTEETWNLNLNTVKQSSGWRGGAYGRTFDRAAQDFRTTFKINSHQRQMGSGKIGQFIYDDNGRLMFSIGYQNVHTVKDSGRILFMAYDEQGNEKVLWGPIVPAKLKRTPVLTIYFRMIRVGQKITMSYWTYDDTSDEGRHEHTLLQPVRFQEFTDSGNFYQRKVASTKFGIFRGNGTHRYLSALGVYMYELLPKPLDARDYVIKQGDIIEIDTNTSQVTINGIPIIETTMSSDYFEIDKGLTTLALMPPDTFDAKVMWNDAYY